MGGSGSTIYIANAYRNPILVRCGDDRCCVTSDIPIGDSVWDPATRHWKFAQQNGFVKIMPNTVLTFCVYGTPVYVSAHSEDGNVKVADWPSRNYDSCIIRPDSQIVVSKYGSVWEDTDGNNYRSSTHIANAYHNPILARCGVDRCHDSANAADGGASAEASETYHWEFAQKNGFVKIMPNTVLKFSVYGNPVYVSAHSEDGNVKVADWPSLNYDSCIIRPDSQIVVSKYGSVWEDTDGNNYR